MRVITIAFFLSFLLISTVNAETYKWEDKNGIHFSDNANSIPKKYRAKALAEASGDITTSDPEVAQEVNRGVRRTRAREAIEQAEAEAEQRRQDRIAAAISERNAEKRARKELANEIGKKVSRQVRREMQNQEALRKAQMPEYHNSGQSTSVYDDYRRREMEDKIDRIDRKSRYGR